MQPSRLLIDLARSQVDAESLAMSDWDAVLRLARSANLIGRLSERLSAEPGFEALPEPVRPHLMAALALSRHQRQAISWEARHIAEALAPLDVQVLLLKGAAYSMAGLRAAHGRLFGDIDILVPEDRLGEVEQALKMHGWGFVRLDRYDERYYRQWMHELPPMVHRRRGSTIDLHHNILPRTAKRAPRAQSLFGAAVSLAGGPFSVLDPCDMVIHSATHLFHEGELRNGLRDLLDLEALVSEFTERSPDFPQRLLERSIEIGLDRPVRLAFRYMASVLGPPDPAGGAPGFAPQTNTGRWLDFFYGRAFKPDHPLCSDVPTSLARWGLYVRGHYLRMPPLLLAAHLARKAIRRAYTTSDRPTQTNATAR